MKSSTPPEIFQPLLQSRNLADPEAPGDASFGTKTAAPYRCSDQEAMPFTLTVVFGLQALAE